MSDTDLTELCRRFASNAICSFSNSAEFSSRAALAKRDLTLADVFPVSNGKLHRERNAAVDDEATNQQQADGGNRCSMPRRRTSFADQETRLAPERSFDASRIRERNSIGNSRDEPSQQSVVKPSTGGIGLELLQKMGWRSGEGLGKQGDGVKEPVAVKFKTDRTGLASRDEQVPRRHPKHQRQQQRQHSWQQQSGQGHSVQPPQRPAGANYYQHQQNHQNRQNRQRQQQRRIPSSGNPVGLLMEFAKNMRWPTPEFFVAGQIGPPHLRLYVFGVNLLDVIYQPQWPSRTKKAAKAAAATLALNQLCVEFPQLQ